MTMAPKTAAVALFWVLLSALSITTTITTTSGTTHATPRMVSHPRFLFDAVAFASITPKRTQKTKTTTTTKTKTTEMKKKKVMPESELIKRRKSPALWREDITKDRNHHHQQQQQLQWYPSVPPEIMAPAGYFPQLQAAIANGANSVYLGCSAFSARARAANFDPVHELPQAVQLAHNHGVKVYVALNTLVFNHELEEVARLVQQIEEAGVDALIVQDLGICKLVQKLAPKLELHASTQQSVTSADGVRHAAALGATRVVLGRELSVREIEKVANEIRNDNQINNNNNNHDKAPESEPVETEVFVHGALCVSYSGQCFSSEAWGGRSANRGQCAQACRLPYGLITDGVLTNLGEDINYLLSPQDLSGLEAVPALTKAGVSCLKIEGRLKSPEYVAATTRSYRNAVDLAWKELQDERYETGKCTKDEYEEALLLLTKGNALSSQKDVVTKAELAQLFSRGQDEDNDGLTPGFFEGPMHQRLVRGRSPRHRGIHMGRVSVGSSPKAGEIIISSHDKATLMTLKRGDGLVIDRGKAQDEELGGPIFDVSELYRDNGSDDDDGGTWYRTVKFGRDVMNRWKKNQSLVPIDAHVWRTHDYNVEKKIKRLASLAPPKAASSLSKFVKISVEGAIGQPLRVIIESSKDTRMRAVGESEGLLEAATNAGLDASKIEKAIGKLGNTEYEIEAGTIDTSALEEGVFCPASWIKAARRKAVESFDALKDTVDGPLLVEENSDVLPNIDLKTNPKEAVQQLILEATSSTSDDSSSELTVPSTRFSILARSFEQVERLCEMVEEQGNGWIDEIIVDFLEITGIEQAVARIREVGTIDAIVASPRIIKPGESSIWKILLRLQPDGLLIRSAGLLQRLAALGGEGAIVDIASKSKNEEECIVTIPPLIGDFSLNPTNIITAGELLNEGLSRITAAYDLNANAITDLAEGMGVVYGGAQRLDVIAHCHIPIFHTEHCVFARFLSNGNSYVDCGHACTRHTVHLRDQSGADNLVLADMGCRNTVFTAQAQSGVHSLKEWSGAGVGRLRIELVDESADDAERVVRIYQEVLAGDLYPQEGWQQLETIRDSNGREGGVSLGSLKNSVERRAGEISNSHKRFEDVF